MSERSAQARRGAIRRNPSETDRKALVKAIADTAPNVDAAARDNALKELQDAIVTFREEYLYVDGEYKKHGSVSESRKALLAFAKLLRKCIDEALYMPMDARWRLSKLRGPIGRLTQELNAWVKVAEVAYIEAEEAPDHPADHARDILAYAVACVLRNTLQRKVTLTSDRTTLRASSRGAAYAKLLRAVLVSAGANAPDDLLPLMRAGKALLDQLEAESMVSPA